MAIHVLQRTQVIPISIDECWDFFSDPRNLACLTPASLDLRVLGDLPPAIHSGLMIRYSVRPLLGIPMTWVTEITHVEENRYFCDDQRIGPYRLWHHEHFFRAIDSDSVEMRDCVHYALPFGVLGDVVHTLFVAKKVAEIFAYRAEAVRKRFGEVTPALR